MKPHRLLLPLVVLVLFSGCSSSRSAMSDAYKPASKIQAKAPQKSTGTTQKNVAKGNTPALKNNVSDKKKRNMVVSTAKEYIGCKYKSGATGPKAFDCSGFTSYVFRQYGVQLARASRDQFRQGSSVGSTRNLLPGDLVFWTGSNAKSKEVGHVGIVVKSEKDGTFTFIHASNSGVRIDNSETIYYKVRYKGARRIL